MSRRIIACMFLITAIACSVPRQAPPSIHPVAVDSSKVGTYPALAQSGGGYFYDQVLEYRVWVHPGGDDYYRAFPTYELAAAYSSKQERAEVPLVLVLQHEHINEPQAGVFEHIKGDRMCEWKVEWLAGSKRTPESISEFLRAKAASSPR